MCCCARGARRLIAEAVAAELMDAHADHPLDARRPALMCKGYLPARRVQNQIGDLEVRVPKVQHPQSW